MHLRRGPALLSWASAMFVGVMAAWLAGCAGPSAGARADRPGEQREDAALARLRAEYADLPDASFVCIAGFESELEALLARVVRGGETGDLAQPSTSATPRRESTGARALRATLPAGGDELRIDGVRAGDAALPRDWSAHTLLLLSVHVAKELDGLEFAIEAGVEPRRWSRPVRLQPGWNLIRQDLAEPAAALPLNDVRAIVLRAPALDAPLQLALDDLILADNTLALLPAADVGERLFVSRQGRRLVVGSAGRFTLGFENGVLVEWRGPDGQNLAAAGGLGPWPAPLREGWESAESGTLPRFDDPAQFSAWGSAIRSRQQLAEMSDQRVVIESMWRFGGGESPAETDAAPSPDDGESADAPPTGPQAGPWIGWRYVIYPTGEVYVAIRTGDPPPWSEPLVGWAIAVRAEPLTLLRGPTRSTQPLRFVFLSGATDRTGDLIWVPARAAAATSQREARSGDGSRLGVVVGAEPLDGPLHSIHLLRVWPVDLSTLPEAALFAAAYQQPARLTVTGGELVSDRPGDLAGDGYNEAEGLFELQAGPRGVRVQFDPAGWPRPGVRLRVRGLAAGECWAYVAGQIVPTVLRDGAGDLILRAPRVIEQPVRIEVHARPAEGG